MASPRRHRARWRRTVYAYACGACNLTHTGGWIAYAVPRPQPIDRHAAFALRKAERCCTCSTCGTLTPASFLECPTCAADWRRRMRWREFCNAWLSIGRAVNGLEPERDDDDE